MNGHFGLAGAYREDPGAALQRQHREREAMNARQERAERWIAERMQGQRFHSCEALIEVATRQWETIIGGAAKPEHLRLIASAARAIWCGLAERTKVQTKINERGRVEYLTFTNAA